MAQKNQIEITDVLIESMWYMPLLWWFSGIPRSPVPFVRLLTWDIHSSLHHHSSMDSWMTAVWCHLSNMKSTLHIPDSLRKSGSTTWRTETGSGRTGWDAMRLRQLVRSWSVNSIKCTSWANGANAIRHCCDLDSWLTSRSSISVYSQARTYKPPVKYSLKSVPPIFYICHRQHYHPNILLHQALWSLFLLSQPCSLSLSLLVLVHFPLQPMRQLKSMEMSLAECHLMPTPIGNELILTGSARWATKLQPSREVKGRL